MEQINYTRGWTCACLERSQLKCRSSGERCSWLSKWSTCVACSPCVSALGHTRLLLHGWHPLIYLSQPKYYFVKKVCWTTSSKGATSFSTGHLFTILLTVWSDLDWFLHVYIKQGFWAEMLSVFLTHSRYLTNICWDKWNKYSVCALETIPIKWNFTLGTSDSVIKMLNWTFFHECLP